MRESRFNQCLETFRNGKNDGLEEIYNKYYKQCMMMSMPFVRNNITLAEEVASITFINIAEYAKKNGGYVRNPGAWIYEIVKNAAYRLIAKENVYVELNEGYVSDNLSDNIDIWLDFHRAIAPLSEKQKEYAKLHYIFELKYWEIAEKFGISENAVKQSFKHIKAHFKEYFKNQ